jgi:GNAT superfamily N-acetyltransferase
MTVWFLEQRKPSQMNEMVRPVPDAGRLLTIELLIAPELSHYRWMFNTVGQPWNWYSRNEVTDLELSKIIHDPRIEVFQLLQGDRLVGFAELDRRQSTEVELKFFGLFPAWTGCGLGRRLLTLVLNQAWSTNPSRVWLHTCSDDHPAALKLYLSAGFQIFDQQS